MSKENIPIAVKQIAENALDKTQRKDVRFNYAQTLENIKAFCEATLNQYNGRSLKK